MGRCGGGGGCKITVAGIQMKKLMKSLLLPNHIHMSPLIQNHVFLVTKRQYKVQLPFTAPLFFPKMASGYEEEHDYAS